MNAVDAGLSIMVLEASESGMLAQLVIRTMPKAKVVQVRRLDDALAKLGSINAVLVGPTVADWETVIRELKLMYMGPVICIPEVNDEKGEAQALALGADDCRANNSVLPDVLRHSILFAIERYKYRAATDSMVALSAALAEMRREVFGLKQEVKRVESILKGELTDAGSG